VVLPVYNGARHLPDVIESILSQGDEEHDVRAATEKILARLEEYLRQDPGQWTVLEAIWGDDCAGR